MEFLIDLWLPILLSAVFVFIASSILHMVLPIHRRDYTKLPGEEQVLEAMRNQGVQAGNYMFPCPASMKDCSSPEMTEKFNKGPVGIMMVKPLGPPAMTGSLIQWFLYTLLISVFVAYIASLAISGETPYLAIFRVAGSTAVLGYAFSPIPDSIWMGQKWSTTAKHVMDGVIFGLVTAGTFAWLWPGRV